MHSEAPPSFTPLAERRRQLWDRHDDVEAKAASLRRIVDRMSVEASTDDDEIENPEGALPAVIRELEVSLAQLSKLQTMKTGAERRLAEAEARSRQLMIYLIGAGIAAVVLLMFVVL